MDENITFKCIAYVLSRAYILEHQTMQNPIDHGTGIHYTANAGIFLRNSGFSLSDLLSPPPQPSSVLLSPPQSFSAPASEAPQTTILFVSGRTDLGQEIGRAHL